MSVTIGTGMDLSLEQDVEFSAVMQGEKGNEELNRYSNATIKERRLYRLALEASFQRFSLH